MTDYKPMILRSNRSRHLVETNLEPMIGYFKSFETHITPEICKHPVTQRASEKSSLIHNRESLTRNIPKTCLNLQTEHLNRCFLLDRESFTGGLGEAAANTLTSAGNALRLSS
jgi:hypothetical protein